MSAELRFSCDVRTAKEVRATRDLVPRKDFHPLGFWEAGRRKVGVHKIPEGTWYKGERVWRRRVGMYRRMYRGLASKS